MRRRLQCLAVVLALLVGLAVPAMAAAPELTVERQTDGSYTVRCALGTGNANAPMALRVVSTSDPAEVLYLAQTAADGNGNVAFTNVRPAIERSMRFLLSGGTPAQTLEKTVLVSGTVVLGRATLHGRADSSGATVTLVPTDGEGSTYTYKTKYDGSYKTDALPAGSYFVTIRADGYQTGERAIVTLAGEDILNRAPVVLYVSVDVNQDGSVDERDVTALLADFGKQGKLASDMNGDGYVNGGDLSLLVESIGQIAQIKPDKATPFVVSLDKMEEQEGIYELRVLPAVNNNKYPVRRVETMISWDSATLTLADAENGYAPVAPESGTNQDAYPGVVNFTSDTAGGVAFYSGQGRNACYVAVSDGTEKGTEMPLTRLYFRFQSGKTEADLHKGSISVETDATDGAFLGRIFPAAERYGAMLGYGGTETHRFPKGGLELQLTYPNSTAPVLKSIEINTDKEILTIPRTESEGDGTLTLTAVGTDIEGEEMALPAGLTWSLLSAPSGVTLVGNVLHASKGAAIGTVSVRAAYGSISAEKTIVADMDMGLPVATTISLKRGNSTLGATDKLTVPGSGKREYTYTAVVLDQYGLELSETEARRVWSLTTADSKVTMSDGVITVAAGADTAKSYTLTATAEQVAKSVKITLAAEPGGGGGGDVSGGGGGGGGGGTPPPTGDGNTTTVTVEAAKEKDGSYTATLDDKAVTEILKTAAQKTGPVVLTATAGERGAKTTMKLPATLSAGLAKAGRTLVVVLPAARLELRPQELGKAGESLAVSARQMEGGHTSIELDNGGKEINFTAKLPTDKNATGGLTAMLVGADGSLTPVRKSVAQGGAMSVPLSGSAVIELKDNSKPFADVAGNWAKSSVDFVTARELFSGTGADAFSPMVNMSRGMLATVLYRLEGEPETAAAAFPDVTDGAWYAKGAVWCANRGIVSGKTGGVFDPDGAVTREELALMLYRLAAPGKTDPPVEQHSFVDGGTVSPWAAEAMTWAVDTGLVTGKSGGRLDPGGTATRAEVATMLERFVKIEYGEGGAK